MVASATQAPSTLASLRARAKQAQTTTERRAMLLDGIAFARFTIQERTDRAERIFEEWKLQGRPTDLSAMPKGLKPQYVGQATTCLADAVNLTDDQVETLWDYTPHESEAYLGKLIRGLGCPKTSFALACAGIGRRGCIDSHIVRNHPEIDHLLSKAARRDRASRDWTPKRYVAAVELIWGTGDTASAQWSEWLNNYVTTTTHEILA